MSFFSISSPNLSFIPPTVSEKIDAKVTNIAFSIWSVQNSATKGIQGMQAVSNLPISARLPLADLNGGKTASGCRGKHEHIEWSACDLIQIKESVVVILPIFLSYSHTLFPATLLICFEAEKTRDIMSTMSVFTREWLSKNWFVMFYWLHYITHIGGRSYSSTTDNLLDFCTNKAEQHLQT